MARTSAIRFKFDALVQATNTCASALLRRIVKLQRKSTFRMLNRIVVFEMGAQSRRSVQPQRVTAESTIR